MKNNKGFSLVELIIVIAIMAILVGVMAPQLIKYIEKTNVSSDTQLCDTIKSAITTAMMDPAVLTVTSNGIPSADTDHNITSITKSDAFGQAFYEIVGKDSASDLTGALKSSNESGKVSVIKFRIVGSNSVHVWIENSDNTGKKKSANDDIYVD